MAVTRLHIFNMIVLAFLGVFILGLSLVTANNLSTSGSEVPIEGWKFYFGRDILPDNVMYPVLMIKDRVIHDRAEPLEQVRLKLLYAENRYSTGLKLLENDQTVLAISTLTKSQKYIISAGYQVLGFETVNKEQLQEVRNAADQSLVRIDEFSKNHSGYDLGSIHQLREDTRIVLDKIDERLYKM